MIERIAASVLCTFARLLTGARPLWLQPPGENRLRIYYANHRSHGDFLLLWSSLPASMRRHTRPVAGADYWLTGPIRRFIATRVFRAVLIDRHADRSVANPVAQMADALASGDALILFPEGTRNMTDEPLLRFRSGLYNLAVARPDVELVPCWIENMSRVLPKGAVLPVPLLCRVVFGAPVALAQGEDRKVFLDRARQALLSLAPEKDGTRR